MQETNQEQGMIHILKILVPISPDRSQNVIPSGMEKDENPIAMELLNYPDTTDIPNTTVLDAIVTDMNRDIRDLVKDLFLTQTTAAEEDIITYDATSAFSSSQDENNCGNE